MGRGLSLSSALPSTCAAPTTVTGALPCAPGMLSAPHLPLALSLLRTTPTPVQEPSSQGLPWALL